MDLLPSDLKVQGPVVIGAPNAVPLELENITLAAAKPDASAAPAAAPKADAKPATTSAPKAGEKSIVDTAVDAFKAEEARLKAEDEAAKKAAAQKAAGQAQTDEQKAAAAKKKETEEEEQKAGKGFNWMNLLGPIIAGALSFFAGGMFGMNSIFAGMLAIGAAFLIGPQISKWLGADGDDKSAKAGAGNQRTRDASVKPEIVRVISPADIEAVRNAPENDPSRVALDLQTAGLLKGVKLNESNTRTISMETIQAVQAQCGANNVALIRQSGKPIGEDMALGCAAPVPAVIAQHQTATRAR